MIRNTARAVLLALASAFFIVACERPVPRGLQSTLIAQGTLTAPVRAFLIDPVSGTHPEVSISKVAMMRVVLEPGGAIRWHEHGGPVWAIVTSGRVAFYEGDDPSCEPRYFEAGDAWLEPGFRVHAARNEGDRPAEVYATFMLGPKVEPRVDAPEPNLCPL